jgi:pimeloyl-ACP methyl ester carboxylesterase
MDTIVRVALVGRDASQTLVDTVQASRRRVAPAVLAYRLRLVLDEDVRAELASISVPVLYVRAEQDRLVGEDALNEVVRCQPRTAIIRVPGPHLLMQREPKRMAEIICHFAQQCV